MINILKQLYTKFLNNKIDIDGFHDFKKEVNQMSDDELADLMKSHWMSHTEYPSLSITRKQEIREYLFRRINRPQKRKWNLMLRSGAAVAAVTILTLAVWNITSSDSTEMQTPFLAEVPAKNRVNLTLPDKSKVKLNSESTLSYHYEKGKRITKLTGEAYFDVSVDKKNPFIVQVGDLNIEVLGTSFNVSSYQESDVVEASLVEGSIRLFYSGDPSVSYTLKPSQKALYSKKNREISFQDTDNVKETAWIQNHLVFESEKLSTVFLRIERWYGVKIKVLCPEIENDPITGSFKDEQLPYVMEALKIQYGFEYEITGNNVIINKSKI